MEESKNVQYKTFQAFRPHFNALARIAYFKLVPKSDSNIKNHLHFAYRVILWIIVVTYNIQHIIKVIQKRHNTDQIVDILFILLTTLATLVKQLTFNIKSKRVDHIISIISGPAFAPRNVHHEDIMKVNALWQHRILRFYIACIFICGSLWTIFPLVNRALGEEVIFTAYFPFETDKSPAFELVVAYMNIFITWQGYGNVTMDCTIVAFYAQVKVQLRILRHDLEHLADFDPKIKSTKVSEFIGYRDLVDETFKRILYRRFVQCVGRHQQIKWFIQEIESLFAETLMFQFLVIAWVICMTVYKIVGLSLFSAEFLSMAMYLCCMLAQLFIYCYFGTQVKYESEFVNQSAYSGNWLSLSPQFRRQLLLLMENCKRPITPRTAYVVPIVLRASYTLFTFLDRK